MTFAQLARRIARMIAEQQAQPVLFIDDLDGPDQQVVAVELVRAKHDIYHGISIGNELIVPQGGWFLQPKGATHDHEA